jgi:hypothetical protein
MLWLEMGALSYMGVHHGSTLRLRKVGAGHGDTRDVVYYFLDQS